MYTTSFLSLSFLSPRRCRRGERKGRERKEVVYISLPGPGTCLEGRLPGGLALAAAFLVLLGGLFWLLWKPLKGLLGRLWGQGLLGKVLGGLWGVVGCLWAAFSMSLGAFRGSLGRPCGGLGGGGARVQGN